MAWARAALALGAVAAVALVLVSGGSDADPRTPAGLPGLPPPFLGTAVVGNGGLTAAVDAYGDVVDLRAPGPAGGALIDNPSDRQTAGTVSADTGIVPRVSVDGGPALPLWRADSVSQRYLPGTNVVRTTARFGKVKATVTIAASADSLAVESSADPAPGILARTGVEANVESRRGWALCLRRCGRLIQAAADDDRRWLSRTRPLGARAPTWARRMYERSLLTLRALASRRTGGVAAGARDGWAYVWPRDAGATCLAVDASGYRDEAREIARYLGRLDLSAAARFDEDGDPVPGRGRQGDAAGWTAACTRTTGQPPPDPAVLPWRDLPDYQESAPGNYLANAITAADGPKSQAGVDKSSRRRVGLALAAAFGTGEGLVRRAGDPGSGLDSAAAWAVRPFPQPALFPQVRRTLLRLAAAQTRFGIRPGEGWTGGVDPWTAPTAWTAWALAALADTQRRDPAAARADRRQALRLLTDLRRAATPAGALPERVDAQTGVPRSTTPLAWSHAFAILALRQLWPGR